MYINVFELVPDNDKPRKDCYDCLGCLHLVAINVDSAHNVSIECNIDNEDKEYTFADGTPFGIKEE